MPVCCAILPIWSCRFATLRSAAAAAPSDSAPPNDVMNVVASRAEDDSAPNSAPTFLSVALARSCALMTNLASGVAITASR